MLDKHPWIALLGFFPPAYLIGLIRVIGNDDYDVVIMNLFDLAVTVPGILWWPLNLYNRKRREKSRRMM